MSLRLLRAEVWANGEQRKLYRVTARTVPNNALDTPAVIAHARLLILGSDNQRLHEELFAAGGYLREGRFARMNEGQLRDVLNAAQDKPVSQDMQQRLSKLWPQYADALAQSLDVRMRDRTTSLQRQLTERSEKEQRDIRAILTELKESIGHQLRESSGPIQMSLIGFSSEERQQFERDLSALEQRMQQIDEEIIQEVARIQQRFADPQPRLFPVTVTYLVPERLAR
jgi:hypothetical protein